MDPLLLVDALLLSASLGTSIYAANRVVRLQKALKAGEDPKLLNNLVRLLAISLCLLCVTIAWLIMRPS